MNPGLLEDDKRLAQMSVSDVQRHLAMSVEYVCAAGVEGDIAEFGTNTGTTASVLATALRFFGSPARGRSTCKVPKRLLLFDSFRGLPASTTEPDLRSPHVNDGWWRAGTCSTAGMNKQVMQAKMAQFLPPSDVLVFDGWFSDTLPQLPAATRFSLLHVDCDLYQSTKDVLDHVFGRNMLSPGAVILFDDWNCNQASPQFGERRAWAETVSRYGVQFDDCGSYAWSARKFIIHDYARQATSSTGASTQVGQ